jgi:hypothetical protein
VAGVSDYGDHVNGEEGQDDFKDCATGRGVGSRHL